MPKKTEKQKGGRKRRNSGRNQRNVQNPEEEIAETADAEESVVSNGENAEGNADSQASNSQKRRKLQTKKSKAQKKIKERAHTPVTESARFEEDDNLVEIEVTGREFLSGDEEGEIDTSDEETDVTFGSQNNNATLTRTRDNSQSPSESVNYDDEDLAENETECDEGADQPSESEEQVTKCNKGTVLSAGAARSSDRNDNIEKKIEQLSNNLIAMQNLMMQQQRQQNEMRGKQTLASRVTNEGFKNDQVEESGDSNTLRGGKSATTIYKQALEFQEDVNMVDEQDNNKKRDSSSSEDHVNTSDELMEIDDEAERFINNCIVESQVRKPDQRRAIANEEPQPSTSGYRQPRPLTRGEEMVREAETAKARMLATSGNKPPNFTDMRVHATAVDEEYVVVGANLEESLIKKIQNQEYVDFARLLTRDKVSVEEDHRMELVSRGGMTYFTPVADRETHGGITSFNKWEQAFRVFSNIYSLTFPERASELIQYNHVIYLASLSFTWENVYLYDKEFRLHMSRHPERNWSIILQQAWTLRMKDRVRHDNWWGNDNGHRGKSNNRPKVKEPCRRFNRGKCNFGNRCKYEHKCSVGNCGKYGHGAHICRKRGNGGNNNHSFQTGNDQSRETGGNSNAVNNKQS